MVEAPERIWAYAVSDGVVTDYNWTDTPNSGTEYIRADIVTSQLAEARAERDTLAMHLEAKAILAKRDKPAVAPSRRKGASDEREI